VKRVLDRKDLYVHGHYRTRVGVEVVRRPELVIVSEDEYQRALKGDVSWAPMPKMAGEVNWDQVPDPVAVPTLSLLVCQPTSWVQRMVTEKGLGATWRGSRMYVSHLAARALEQEAKRIKSHT
jgi:hypothetical protein